MAMRKSAKSVETLVHDKASRKNIPTAEHEPVMAENDRSPVEVAYERRNRGLDPQLVRRGKDEQNWSDLVVHAPPLFVQEKVHPKALINDLPRHSKTVEAERLARESGFQTDLFADFNGFPSDDARTECYQHDANWIYGSKKDGLPPVIQSQNPDIKRLGEVLAHAQGLHVLETTRNLGAAHASTEPADSQFIASLIRATDNMRDAVGSLRAHDRRDRSLLDIAEDVKETAEAVHGRMVKKRREVGVRNDGLSFGNWHGQCWLQMDPSQPGEAGDCCTSLAIGCNRCARALKGRRTRTATHSSNISMRRRMSSRGAPSRWSRSTPTHTAETVAEALVSCQSSSVG